MEWLIFSDEDADTFIFESQPWKKSFKQDLCSKQQ